MKVSFCKITRRASCLSALGSARRSRSRLIPACQRLEAQLATLDRGNSDPARADQIRRAEDAVNRQQFEVDRLVAQSRRMGCESSGFFSIFSNPPPQCGALSRQIDQQRNAPRAHAEPARAAQGGTDRARGSAAVAADCARRQWLRPAIPLGRARRPARRILRPPVRRKRQQRVSRAPTGPMGGTFRTVCVRTCDGFYFPISYATIAGSLPRRRADLPAHVSGGRGVSSTPITIPARK